MGHVLCKPFILTPGRLRRDDLDIIPDVGHIADRLRFAARRVNRMWSRSAKREEKRAWDEWTMTENHVYAVGPPAACHSYWWILSISLPAWHDVRQLRVSLADPALCSWLLAYPLSFRCRPAFMPWPAAWKCAMSFALATHTQTHTRTLSFCPHPVCLVLSCCCGCSWSCNRCRCLISANDVLQWRRQLARLLFTWEPPDRGKWPKETGNRRKSWGFFQRVMN